MARQGPRRPLDGTARLRGVHLRIRPEPSDAERAAIAKALERRAAEEAAATDGGAWWRAGIEESLREDFAADE